MFNLAHAIDATAELEPLPQSVTRLSALAALEDWRVGDAVEIVSMDPALTGRLLYAANSAGSGGARDIATVREAIVRLGLRPIVRLAMAGAVQRSLSASLPIYGLGEGELWRHSVATALIAEAMPRYLGRALPYGGFTASLLHDIGKVVMARELDEETCDILARALGQSCAHMLEAEREVLEVHHGELGALVVQAWQLPEAIKIGVQHHHTPGEAEHSVADLVHVADFLAKQVDGVDHGLEEPDELDPGSLSRLGLDEAALVALRAEVAPRLEELLARYA